MQGLGLFTLEELHYSPQGVLLTRGPGSYKIPAFGDIPTKLTVSLLRDAPNDKAIFASKVTPEAACDILNGTVQTNHLFSFVSFLHCRRSANLLSFWQRRFSTPSKMPSALPGRSRASLVPSGSTAPPPPRGSAMLAATDSPNWYESCQNISLCFSADRRSFKASI